MGFGGAVFFLGLWVLGQPLRFASAAYEFDAIACINGNGSLLEVKDISPALLRWAQEGVDAHNKLRKKHGTPPLVLNPDMCKTSQWAANYNAETTSMYHMIHAQKIEGIGIEGMKCGENLMSSNESKAVSANDTTHAWYSEISRYDFAKNAAKPDPVRPDKDQVVGHFVQVVWKATKEMCMTYAQAKTGEYFYAAHYFPPAMYGTYAENVLNLNSANHDHFKFGIILILILCVHFF